MSKTITLSDEEAALAEVALRDLGERYRSEAKTAPMRKNGRGEPCSGAVPARTSRICLDLADRVRLA